MWCLPSKNGEMTRAWLDLPDPGKAFLRPLCCCCSLPAAARLESVELRHSSAQPCSHRHPQIAGAALGFVFLLFLFGQKQQGIFFTPWKNSSVWFEKGWGQEMAGKGCLIVFLVTWLLLCTCTRLPLVRTGPLLGSQDGAVAEETSSTLQSHPVFSFSLCHHFTEQNPELTLHISTAIPPCVPSCWQDGKVAATSSKGIDWQVILRALFPLGMYLLVLSILYFKMRSLIIQKMKETIKGFCERKAWEEKEN